MKFIRMELPDEDAEKIVSVARSQGWRYKTGRIEPSWIDGIEHYRQDEKYYPYTKKERQAGLFVVAAMYAALTLGTLVIVTLAELAG